MQNKILYLLLIILIIILLIHIPAIIYYWYYKIYWIDTPMHLLGGLWAGFLFFYLIEKFKLIENLDKDNLKNKIFITISAIGFVSLVGILWEFYEFAVDVLVLKKYPYYNVFGYILFDTLKDLFNDLIGVLWSIIIYLKIPPSRRD